MSPQPQTDPSSPATQPPGAGASAIAVPTSTNGAAPGATGQAPTAQPSGAPGGLARARLVNVDANDSLDVHYNPTQVTLTKTAITTAALQQAAKGGAPPAFIASHTRKLSFTLTLEAWSTDKDVVAAVNKLQSWLNPLPASLRKGPVTLPTIEFHWWNNDEGQPFVGVMNKADATYAVFGHDGRPVRATVTVEMNEVPKEPAKQNPTSGSPAGGRTALVREGDSLASIAYHEYGDPGLWRGLAVANRIADPTGLTAGQRLTLPAPAHARELAR